MLIANQGTTRRLLLALALLAGVLAADAKAWAQTQTQPATAAATAAEHDGSRVQRWIEAGGYVVLFGLLFACGLGMPMPEDIPLLVAGFLIAQGKMQWVHAGVFAWCGIIGGDCILYHLGHRFGRNITRVPLVGKHVTAKRIERAEVLFDRWGVWVVAVGRLFAGIRGAMVIAAGTIRFSFIKFLIADGLAAIVSGGMFMAVGYWAGQYFGNLGDPAVQHKIKDAKHYLFGGAILLAVLIVLYVMWRRRRHATLAEVAMEKAVETVDPPAGPDRKS